VKDFFWNSRAILLWSGRVVLALFQGALVLAAAEHGGLWVGGSGDAVQGLPQLYFYLLKSESENQYFT